MSEWQPIETAPKNVWIILREDKLVWIGGYEEETGKWQCQHSDFDGFPTHWQPLPLPPKETP